MRCIGCGSTAVPERIERTAQGYRRFRCRACGKQFNERSLSVLNRTQLPVRRHCPRGALAAPLQTQLARLAGDVPDPRHRVQP
jgi:transposase-like protein